MKFKALIILGIMLVAAVSMAPSSTATEKEYKELNPVHVANVSVATDIAVWGENLAWASGGGNITTGTVSGGAGTKVNDAQYWGYDLGMSDSAIVWSAAATDVTSRSDIYSVGLGGGSKTYQGINTNYDERGVRIDGNTILYEGMGELESYLKVATVGASSATTLPITYPDSGNYDISGDYIVGMGDYSALQIYNTDGSLEKDLGQGWYATENLRISGDYICYYDLMDFGNGANLFVKNWRTNETHTIIGHMEGQPGGMDIEGNFVVFAAQKNPEAAVDGGGACMFIYDIQAETTFRVSDEYNMIMDYAVGDGWITWVTRDYNYYGTETYYNIYAAELPAPGAAPVDDPITYPDDECAQYRFVDGPATVPLDTGIKFTADDGEHRIYARDITATGATLDVYSDFHQVTLNVGETQTVEGLDITLNSVDPTNQTCDVTVADVANSILDGGTDGDSGGFLGLPAPGFWLIITTFAAITLAVRFSRKRKP